MKKTYLTLGLLLVSGVFFAQTNVSKKADQLFESYQYVNAIDAYLQLVKNNTADQHVYQNLADSYYQIFNSTEAIKWYEKVIQGKTEGETYYRYAQSLKSLGKYDEANKLMDKFASMLPNDERAKVHKSNPNYLNSLQSSKALFEVETTKIAVEKSQDFGPILTNDNDFYFVSTRKQSKTDKWTNQPYLDIFKASRNEDGSFSEIVEVKELNTPFHDGSVAISQDGNTMFFARDGHSSKLYEKDKKNNVKIGQLGIYKSVKVDGKWTVVGGLPMNSISYSVSHPALSADGKTLYFSSNMPGGLGETDIWKIAITENGYGKPENLGNFVNTAGREAFPYIDSDEVLYFASTGHQGFGGLDIFKADLKNGGKAINVGKPVNTEKDDFSLSINSQKNIGYFASNRSGNDNIYQAIPVCGVSTNAIITDAKTGSPIQNATIKILDSKNKLIATKESNNIGSAMFELNCDTPYIVEVSASNYKPLVYNIEKTKQNNLNLSLALTPNEVIITDKEVILGDVYFEFDKSNITVTGAQELNKLVKVMQDYPTMVILVKAHTDSKGNNKYNLRLSEQRAQATVQYLVSRGISKDRLSGKGYGSSEPKVNCGADCTDEQNAINRRSEFIIVKK